MVNKKVDLYNRMRWIKRPGFRMKLYLTKWNKELYYYDEPWEIVARSYFYDEKGKKLLPNKNYTNNEVFKELL